MKLKEEDYIEEWLLAFLGWKPFPYQKDFLLLCCKELRVASLWCRQSGKSTDISKYCLFKILNNSNITILIVAPSQRQSSELFGKIKADIELNKKILEFTETFTQTQIVFKNKSRIIALPSGPDGKTIRGFKADIIIVEEAGEMKNYIVTNVLLPMIGTVPNGQLIKIGTPHGRNHFYESCYGENSKYKLIQVDWKRAVKEGILQQSVVDEAREASTDTEFKMEWEAEFPEDADCFFKYSLLEGCEQDYTLYSL